METVTADAVWQAFLQENFKRPQPEKILAVLEPFVKALPAILRHQLDKPVTLRSILESRVLYFRYVLLHGLTTAYATNGPKFLRNSAPVLDMMLNQVVAVHEMILENPEDFLDRLECKAEDEYLISQFELNEDMVAAYHAGTLTIGRLLLHQPLIFVRET